MGSGLTNLILALALALTLTLTSVTMWPRRCEVEMVTAGGARPVVSFGLSNVPG